MMKPAGLAAVEAAKADGRWENAYESQNNMEMPADFLAALEKTPKAKSFFKSLNKQNKYAFAYRLQQAKRPETRAKRFKQFLEMLDKGEKFY